MNDQKNLITKFLLFLTTISFFYLFLSLENYSKSEYLVINFLDVGQGDSILIETPEGNSILVDAGESSSIVSSISDLMSPTKKNFDLAILTHPHADHLGGFIYLSEYYNFDKVVQEPLSHNSDMYINWLEYLSKNSVDVDSVYIGDVIEIESDLTLEILWPKNEIDLEELSLNNTSIVVMLKYFDFRVLLMGDAEVEVENELLRMNADLDADVLKAGHHGSETSSSEHFIEIVSPEVTIISVGEGNQFNHPSENTILTLQNVGSEIYRTDESGNIYLFSDGKSFWIED